MSGSWRVFKRMGGPWENRRNVVKARILLDVFVQRHQFLARWNSHPSCKGTSGYEEHLCWLRDQKYRGYPLASGWRVADLEPQEAHYKAGKGRQRECLGQRGLVGELRRMGSDAEMQGLDLGLLVDPLWTALVGDFILILYRFLHFDPWTDSPTYSGTVDTRVIKRFNRRKWVFFVWVLV